MFNLRNHLLKIIGITILSTTCISTAALAESSDKTSKIAEEITVLIKDNEPPIGSGVIIDKKNQTYYVLTAKHVVEEMNMQEDITISTSDEQEHLLLKDDIQYLAEIDLAIVKFTSTKNYRVATIGNSEVVQEGSKTFVSGFPNPSLAIPRPVFNFTEGKVTSNNGKSLIVGYALIYSNNTLPGMSGGSVLNEQGHLIAIHGLADTVNTADTEREDIVIKTGFNLGIPINVLEQHKHESPISLRYADSKKSKITPQLYQLESLLQEKQFWEADIETKDLLLGHKQYLNEPGIKNLSCDLLVGIDELWKKNSRGRFGFTTQKLVWDNDFDSFANDTGWLYRGSWSPPQKSQYNLEAPRGHLPRKFLDGEAWSYFIDKLDKCEI